MTSPSRSLGVFIPWSSRYLNDLDAYTALVGARPKLVMWFSDWTRPLVPASRLDAVTRRGATPQITWEPWDAGGTANQPTYSLARINAGAYDAYIRASASAAAAYGKPFQIRFAHEMNAGWTSWGAGVNSNTGNQYVAAWRRVVAIFRARGATNVSWVWAPNVDPRPFAQYYPGDKYVDVIGLDGYNWGTLDRWQTFTDVFGKAYDAIRALAPSKRIIISETASAESGGDKGAWITNSYRNEIPRRFPSVDTVVWFDKRQHADWRVNSSVASLAAYRSVAALPSWSGAGSTETSTPTPERCVRKPRP